MTKTRIPELALALSVVLVGATGKGAAAEGGGCGDCVAAVSLAELDGLWAQLYRGRVIALKKITVDGNMATMEYIVLHEGFRGGEYSAMKTMPDGAVVIYEDYGDMISRHTLRRIDAGTLYGVQSSPNQGNLVHTYIMQRIREQ